MVEYVMFLLLVTLGIYMIVFYFNVQNYLIPTKSSSVSSSSSSLSSSSILSSFVEGLTNKDEDTQQQPQQSTQKKKENMIQSGDGAVSSQFAQVIANTIATYDTRLNIPTYGQQYQNIIHNLRDLYERKALAAVLKPVSSSNATTLEELIPQLELYLCTQNLQSLDNLEEFVKANTSRLPTRLF